MLLDTSSTMFLDSLGLSTSYILLQVTQQGLNKPQLVSRWLASLPPWLFSLSQRHLEALSVASVGLKMALLFLSPLMPKLLKALAREWAPTTNSHWETFCFPSSLLIVADKSSVHGELPFGDFLQLIFQWECQLQQYSCFGGLRHNIWLQGGCWNVAKVCYLLLKVHQQLPVPSQSQNAYSVLAGFGCSPALTKAMALLALIQLLHWWLRQWSSAPDHVSISTIPLQMPLCSSWGSAPWFLAWNTAAMLMTLLWPTCADSMGMEAHLYCFD